MRFTSSDGTTIINYWIQSYDSNAQTATVWVKVPTITASTTTTIYIYYGNSSVSDTGNGNNVFSVYDSFTTNETTRSYATVAADAGWYGSFNLDTPVGGYSGKHHKKAWYFSGTYHRTYMVYADTNVASKIAYYDHDSKTFSSTVKVADSPVADGDYHRGPTLTIDSSGYIYVFYGASESNLYMKRSTNPEDISSWGSAVAVDNQAGSDSPAVNGATYPQPFFINNTLYVFYRKSEGRTVGNNDKPDGFKTSTDGGSTWSSYNKVVDFNHPYNIYSIAHLDANNRIHLAWSYLDIAKDPIRENVYYAYSDDGGTTWKNAGGAHTFSLPISKADADSYALVYDSLHIMGYIHDVDTDSSGNPHILFYYGAANAEYWRVASWNGSSWQNTSLNIAQGDDDFDWGAIKVDSATQYRVYLPIGGNTLNVPGGEIEEYTTTDSGQSWSNTRHVTYSSREQNNYPKTVQNGQSDLEIMWGGGDSAPTKVYAWGQSSNFTSTFSDWLADDITAFTYNGGTLTESNGRIEITTNTTGYTRGVVTINPVANQVRYERIRFNPNTLGGYRYQPLGFTWTKTGLEGFAHWALIVDWSINNHLRLIYTQADGGALNIQSLSSTSPIADQWYLVELWQVGTTTNIKITKESDSSIIYSGSVTTFDYSAASLYAAFGQYNGQINTMVGYYDDWIVRQFSSPEPSTSAASETTLYPTDNPTINPTSANAQAFTSLSAFAETATKNGGQIKYQISNNSGTTWYWYNSGWITTSSGYTEANTASDINSNISTLPVGSGSFLFKAYLNSDGSQLVQLDSITLTYSSTLSSFDLSSPDNDSYTNSERPTFKWKSATTPVSGGLSKYKLEVDNGDSGDFTIDDIPTSRTTDYDTNKYLAHYENFSDSDSSNNYISVHTKSTSDWTSENNDGKLKEGKRTWKVIARDNAGNEREESRTLFVDRTGPNIEVARVNDRTYAGNISTTDKTPTIYGKITDSLSGDKTDNKVAAGPKSVEVKIEKKNNFGTYDLYSLTTVTINEKYWTSDGSKISDNSRQTSDKYSTFSYTPSDNLPLGIYRITVTGKDDAGNTGSSKLFNLTITTLGKITTKEEKKVIEEEIKELTPEEREKLKEELEITKPEEIKPETKPSRIFLPLTNSWEFIKNQAIGASSFVGKLVTYTKDVSFSGFQTLTESFKTPKQFTSRFGEWLSYATISFGEIVLDTKPTQISEVKVEKVILNSVIISWKTNHLATSKVNYGTTLDYGKDVQSNKKIHEHRIEITGLKPGQRYFYEVMSQNKNYVYDANHEFTTQSQ